MAGSGMSIEGEPWLDEASGYGDGRGLYHSVSGEFRGGVFFSDRQIRSRSSWNAAGKLRGKSPRSVKSPACNADLGLSMSIPSWAFVLDGDPRSISLAWRMVGSGSKAGRRVP